MKIAVVGKGNVGGGLADRWERAGHEVTRIGKEGGDVSDADAVLIAVPGGAVGDALEKVEGIHGKTVIDATNLVGAGPPAGFGSNAAFVKSKTGGPTAKAFNLNFARVYDRLDDMKQRPGNIWSGDDWTDLPRLILSRVTFESNKATAFGGALAFAGSVQGDGLVFRFNQAPLAGGAIASWRAATWRAAR